MRAIGGCPRSPPKRDSCTSMPSYSGKVVVERFEPNDTWTGTVVEDEQPTERNNRGDVSNKKSVIATDFGEIKEENLGVFES